MYKRDKYYECEYLSKRHDDEKICNVTKRQYISKILGLSEKDADRYIKYQQCHEKIKPLFKEGVLHSSCMDYIAYKSEEKQLQMYYVIIDVIKDGVNPARDRIIQPLSKAIEMNPSVTWEDLKPSIKPLKRIPREKIEKELDSESTTALGDRFTTVVVNFMHKNGFPLTDKNKRISADFKADAFARDENNATYAVQCKYHSEKYKECTEGVREAILGKINYEREKAIAVTNTKFTKKAIEYAEENGVILWDGEYLRDRFGWDGTI